MKKLLLTSSLFIAGIGFLAAQINPGISVTVTPTPANSCVPPCDGSAIANASGGTPPYTYQWSTTPTQTAQTATGLCPGTYTVAVTGGGGTISIPAVGVATITCKGVSTGTLSVSTVGTAASACTPPCNGTATATPTGGTPPYTYAWGTIPIQTTQVATGLCPGSYSMTIFDSSLPPNQAKDGVTITCLGTTGINNVLDYNGIQLFPNPAHNELTIKFDSTRPEQLTMLVKSVLGNTLIRQELGNNSNSTTKIDISSLPIGIYMLEFVSDQYFLSKSFIKQ